MTASFYAAPAVGATTAVAVFFHEIPHEIGDYAILVQSGFTKRHALLSQFATALAAFAGTFAGIFIEEAALSDHRTTAAADGGWLGTDVRTSDLAIPFTAGGFLYIATIGVIPELLEVSGRLSKDLRQAAIEFAAMTVGVAAMAFIS
jgi:zinc transporter 7